MKWGLERKGPLSRGALLDLHGGDDQGLFSQLRHDKNGNVPLEAWLSFLTEVRREKGASLLGFLLRYLERRVLDVTQNGPGGDTCPTLI